MVAAVDLGMTIHAGLVDNLGLCTDTRGWQAQPSSTSDLVRMTAGGLVAGCTQEGRTRFEHGGLVGAVRGMARRAVVGGRWVLPQERTAFFRVAGVASFVDVVLDKLFRSGGSVRVVATGAGHFAFIHRMVRQLVGICTLLLVACVTDFSLLSFDSNFVLCIVHGVARCTGDVIGGMRTTIPVHVFTA